MSIRIKTIAIASLAVSASAFALSNAALAAPVINFAIQTNQLSTPSMKFEFKGGKYVWEQKTINTQFAASANTNDNWLQWYGPLHVATLGLGGDASFTGKVPEFVKAWSLSGPMQFPVSFLNAYQGNFAEYCNANGGTKAIVKHGLSVLFTVRQAYEEKRLDGDPAPEQIDEDGGAAVHTFYAHRTVTMPVVVVCGAKPASTQPRPGGVVQKEPDFKVKSIALNYGGVPGKTKPNPATECKQAKLTVSFKTSKAGVVDFRLHKQIGNGPIQAKNVQVYAKFDGNAHFVASHQEIVSVEKTTRVQAMAEELVNPINLKTGWKDVTLRCEDIGGGFASTPGNSGPGGKPKVDPKRVFDGPGNFSIGKPKPTHSTNKPVIAPAVPKKPVQTKTAPARQGNLKGETGERRIGIGQLLPAIQKVR